MQGLYHPDRFNGPQQRDGATWRSLGWDDALKTVAGKIGELRQAGRGRAVALVTQLESGSLGALMDQGTQALGVRPTFEIWIDGRSAFTSSRAASRTAPVSPCGGAGSVSSGIRI